MHPRLVVAVLLLISIISPAHAAEKSRNITTRAEVQESVKKFFAFSQSDVSAALEMYDQTPNIISILDGRPARGMNEIIKEINSDIHIGYHWELGVIEVLPIGSNYAISVVPYSKTMTDAMGIPMQMLGVSTLVWQKIEGKWIIIHEHESTKRP